MRVYLVDLENCGDAFKNIEDDDYKASRCFIVYSDVCEQTYNKYISVALKYFRHVDSLKVKNSCKNALDFNLSLYLGYIIGKFRGNKVEIVIISKDKGYSNLEYALKTIAYQEGIDISFSERPKIKYHYSSINLDSLLCCDNGQTVLQLIISMNYYDKWSELIKLTCPYLSEAEYNLLNKDSMFHIKDLCTKLNRSIKAGIHCYLVKKEGQELGTKIYRDLKRTKIYDLCRIYSSA